MASDESWLEDCPSETLMAVPVTETTAGVEVTLYDLDEADMPYMVEVHQYYPPEDDEEGESVYLHGEYATLQLISALSELPSERFSEVPFDDGE